jgi:quercetin 2,3-dioxygenase
MGGVSHPVVDVRPLGFPWQPADPFLFCVHHDDAYPAGNEQMGPAESLAGRNLGQDFAGKDGWRMYHGRDVPGFPQHPHRGFETVTIVRRGLIDHSDSLGAAARFGRGDVQWLTAGGGIVHSEMFPLLERGAPNPLELFQIWLNLPAKDKLVAPHFSMLWAESIPHVVHTGDGGKRAEITVYAGDLASARPPPPPPRSWAARPDTAVVIASLRLEAGASWVLPPATISNANRTLFFFRGRSLGVGGRQVGASSSITLRPDVEAPLHAEADEVEVLLLQGRPIAEPVVQYGPFVMNSPAEIQRAMNDFRQTGFGGWPWPSDGPVHGRDPTRFARHADGHTERREG